MNANQSILWFGCFVLVLVSIYQTRNLRVGNGFTIRIRLSGGKSGLLLLLTLEVLGGFDPEEVG